MKSPSTKQAVGNFCSSVAATNTMTESFNDGFRFIWRRPDGSLQGARGQARIPSLKHARLLMAEAEKKGWGNYQLDANDRFIEPHNEADKK